MGKRKKSSRKPQGPKKNAPLPTAFACLFCNHEGSISVKMDKKAGVGDLSCKICGKSFQTGINYLSAAVDVYSDWVDACDAVAGDSPDGNDDTWTPPRAGRIAEEDQGRKVEDLELNRGVSDDDVEGESL